MAIRVTQGSRTSFAPRPSDIPEVRTRIPEQRFVPTSSASASALQTLGSTIIQTGEVLGRAGAIDQARDETREVDALELNLKNKLFEFQYGSADGTIKGWGNERGQEFLDPGTREMMKTRLAFEISEIRKQLTNPRSSEEFNRVAAQLVFSQNVAIAAKGVEERHAAEVATDAAFVDSHVRNIIASPITGQIAINPQGSQQELIKKYHLADLAGIVARTNALADRLSIPRGTGKATDTEAQRRGEVARRLMREDALTKAHGGVIARFLEEGKAEEANQYFDAFRLQIDPNKRGEIQRTILAGAVGEDARAIVNVAKVKGTAKERLAMGEVLSKGHSDAVAKEVRSRLTLINAEQRRQETEFDADQAGRLSQAVQDVSGKDITEVFSLAEQTYFQGKGLWRSALVDQATFKRNGDLPANVFIESSLIQAQLDGTLSNIDITLLRRQLGKRYQHWVTQKAIEVGDERKIDAALKKITKEKRYATTKVGPAMTAGVDVLKAANLNDKEMAAVRKAVADNLTFWGEAGKTDPTDSEYIRMVESAVQKVITNPGVLWDTTEMGADAALQNTAANIKDFNSTMKKWASESGIPENDIRKGYAVIAANPRILKNLPNIMLALKVEKKRADRAAVVTAQPKAQARTSITLTAAQAERTKTLEVAGATPTSQADLAALVKAELGAAGVVDPADAIAVAESIAAKVRAEFGEETAKQVEAVVKPAPAQVTQLLDTEEAQAEVDREIATLERIPTNPTIPFRNEADETEAKELAVKEINRAKGRALSKADLKVTKKKVDKAMERARKVIIERKQEEATERREQAEERQRRLQIRIDTATEERAALMGQKGEFTVADLEETGSRDSTPVVRKEEVADAFMETVFQNEGGATIDFDGRALLKLGITGVRKDEVDAKAGRELSEEEAARAIAIEDFEVFIAQMPGFKKLPIGAQVSLVDLSYAMGTGPVMKTKKGKPTKMAKAVARGDVEEAMRQTLDTANAVGKSFKGIAVRRARMHNRALPKHAWITRVQQDPDGRITYIGKKENTILTYKPKKGRHPDSRPGTVKL